MRSLISQPLESAPQRTCISCAGHRHANASDLEQVRVFRPACDGRHEAASGQLVIADATTWPGIPIAAWPPADPSVDYAPPRGRGIQAIRDDTALACWLPIKPGLTVHGLRHSHKTWMAEDGIPEILAEHRLGHQVPSMRGFYTHASHPDRDELKHALQAR